MEVDKVLDTVLDVDMGDDRGCGSWILHEYVS
jgi:hypothetical protein